MGHQISCGSEKLNITDWSNLIVSWCETFTPTVKPDDMSDYAWRDLTLGVTDISASAVKLADEKISQSYGVAVDQGLVDPSKVSVQTFIRCREFLQIAAHNGSGIYGSY